MACADDVDGDAGEGERRRRSRCRARSRPCARGSSRPAAASRPSAARGTAPRLPARRDRRRGARPARCATPMTGRERVLGAPGDQQHGRQERRREQRRDRRRRLGVGVGKPVVHRRPADLGGEAGEQQQVRDERGLGRAVRSVGSACQESAPSPPPGHAGGEHDDAEQSDAEPERGEDQVLPARLERTCLAAEADEQRGCRGRRLDRAARPRRGSPPAARRAAPPRRRRARRSTLAVAAPRRRATRARSPDTRARRARWRGRRRAITPTSRPPAASTTIQSPTSRSPGSAERERRQRERQRGGRERTGDGDGRHQRARARQRRRPRRAAPARRHGRRRASRG